MHPDENRTFLALDSVPSWNQECARNGTKGLAHAKHML
jgi:hypothetical protein